MPAPTRILRWTNPATRTRGRHRAAALPLAIGAALMLAGTAIGGWSPTLTLRQLPFENDLRPMDLSAHGLNVVAGWSQEPADTNFSEMWVRESTNAGDGFAAAVRLAVDPTKKARNLSLDSGGGSHWAAWSEKRPTAAWPLRERVFLGAKPYGAGFWDYVPVSINADIARFPTVVHTTGLDLRRLPGADRRCLAGDHPERQDR